MSVSVWTTIERSPVGEVMRSSSWLYPATLTLHLLSMAVLVGGGMVLDLRLIGWVRIPLRPLLRVTEPALLGATIVSVLTGGLLFTTETAQLAADLTFQVKMLLLAAMIGNAVGFTFGVRRVLDSWEADPRPPLPARFAGTLGLVGWISVAIAGRLIAF